ncbi:DUF5131 family protein [Nocardia shimofusensis]|uniref:DUF5131 family protein n=1 Tax=Nocardia shimofusensis TaxID=228596 RepID=UPI0008318BFA|nr:phage Gp37/Gp68 family protein [Nocardia shimofusensis]
MSVSSIEWTEVTWNPVTGCDRISAGCDNCYALKMAKRLKAMGAAKYQTDGDPRTSGPGFGVAVHDDAITEPLRWRSPRKVFVNSMSDIAHARVSPAAQARIWAVMALTPRHQFQVLTKRPKRLANLLSDRAFYDQVKTALWEVAENFNGPIPVNDMDAALRWIDPRNRLSGAIPAPLPNVWLGTSIETDEYCWRADELRRTPAAIRFLSCEPLLGPLPSLDLTAIDWLIVGGESGPGFRPLDLDWVRELRDRCVQRRVSLFFKQVGGVRPKAGGRSLDGRTWDEYPTRVSAGVGHG